MTTTITPGQPATTREATPPPLGSLVRYHGSLEDEHGYYRVWRILPNGRLMLNRGTGRCPEGQTLSNVGPASVTFVLDGTAADALDERAAGR